MQTNKEQLRRQQAVMRKFGFYNGKLDGIWGPSSIDAKKRFEADESFKPGYPNNGMPFKDTGPFPKGITMRHGNMPMIHCDGIEEILAKAASKEADANALALKIEQEAVSTGEVVPEEPALVLADETDIMDSVVAEPMASKPQDNRNKHFHKKHR